MAPPALRLMPSLILPLYRNKFVGGGGGGGGVGGAGGVGGVGGVGVTGGVVVPLPGLVEVPLPGLVEVLLPGLVVVPLPGLVDVPLPGGVVVPLPGVVEDGGVTAVDEPGCVPLPGLVTTSGSGILCLRCSKEEQAATSSPTPNSIVCRKIGFILVEMCFSGLKVQTCTD